MILEIKSNKTKTTYLPIVLICGWIIYISNDINRLSGYIALVVGSIALFYYFIIRLDKTIRLYENVIIVRFSKVGIERAYNLKEIEKISFTATQSAFNTKEIVVYHSNGRNRYQHIYTKEQIIQLANELKQLNIAIDLSSYYR